GTATATVSATLTVAEGDKFTTATPLSLNATEGTPFKGAVATFTDTGYTSNSTGDFTATILWGDGKSTKNAAITTGGKGLFTVSGTHTYADESAGALPVKVTISDDAPGTATATVTSTITVGEADTLTATPITGLTATESFPFTGTVATFSDPGYPTNSASDFNASIKWGDGKSSA